MTRPPPGYRGPSDPADWWAFELVDGRARRLLDRWAACFATIALRMSDAEQGAAAGAGQGDIRTYQRGGDPVVSRLDWGPDDGPWEGPGSPPPWIADTRDRYGDTETKLLRQLHQRMCDSLAYDVDRFERELRPPEKQTG